MNSRFPGVLSFLCLLSLGASATTAIAQETVAEGTQLTADLHIAVGDALNRATYQKAPVEVKLKDLQQEVTKLEAAVNSGRTNISVALVENLKSSTAALNGIKSNPAAAASEELVKLAIDDIRLKNAADEENYRLFGAARPIQEVTVKINAIRNDQRQNGFSAILVPFGYGKAKGWKDGELDIIPAGARLTTQFTPDATVKVLPGMYFVHIYKTKLLATRPTQVQFDTKEIDVTLP